MYLQMTQSKFSPLFGTYEMRLFHEVVWILTSNGMNYNYSVWALSNRRLAFYASNVYFQTC